MDSKLQQAIIAVRTGYAETAQLLLAEVIQENPEQTEAWFLLAHLVESPERQARYLEYALSLEPDHLLARQHLERLHTPAVPPPVIKDSAKFRPSASHKTPPPALDSEFSPIPPARTNPVVAVEAISEPPAAVSQQTPRPVVVEQKSSRIDAEWKSTAGRPRRAVQEAIVVPVPKPEPDTASKDAAPRRNQTNKWLLALLLILVAVATFVMSFLAYTFFFR